MLANKRILLIISGGIAAFRALELIRRLRDQGASVTPVLTKSAEEFVTPLSVSALAASKVYRDLFDLTDEAEMGHIELSRSADLILVAPATANIMTKMAQGLCDDLATTLLLATDTPVMIAPAMNVRMWDHPATQTNLATLLERGVTVVGPDEGAMACGEFGPGRLAEVPAIVDAVTAHFADGPLAGKRIIVTSGPTHEPIDPVRYIANRSSGAQGTAIAIALRDLGANVEFVTGPADVAAPAGVTVHAVQTAQQMLDAVQRLMPADAAVCAAAVADWRVTGASDQKIKKDGSGGLPTLEFAENPDILATISQGDQRPGLVIGFAAETENVMANATAKRDRKGCDWIIANDVSPETGIMGGNHNTVTIIDADGADTWPNMPKTQVAQKLAIRIADALA
ncbi:MAG: bifunctional phosphopantothenoylcysteine decarboxylase/phosphopantothenate--cysteine ligase CoaBC [Pseudomonadota bacterium]